MGDMPSANVVWMEALRELGFERYNLPDQCPNCYTVEDFCSEHQEGLYILGTGTHVVATIDGKYYDSWDSGKEVPVFFFKYREER